MVPLRAERQDADDGVDGVLRFAVRAAIEVYGDDGPRKAEALDDGRRRRRRVDDGDEDLELGDEESATKMAFMKFPVVDGAAAKKYDVVGDGATTRLDGGAPRP